MNLRGLEFRSSELLSRLVNSIKFSDKFLSDCMNVLILLKLFNLLMY